MGTRLKKMFIDVDADGLEINDFIQNLINIVAKIREQQIKNGVVDNKIMVYSSTNNKSLSLQYYDVEITEEEQ